LEQIAQEDDWKLTFDHMRKFEAALSDLNNFIEEKISIIEH